MSERIRIQLHEANDIDRLIRDYMKREPINDDDMRDILTDYVGGSEAAMDTIIAQFVGLIDDGEDRGVNLTAIEDLVNRIGEIYEKALARNGQVKDRLQFNPVQRGTCDTEGHPRGAHMYRSCVNWKEAGMEK